MKAEISRLMYSYLTKISLPVLQVTIDQIDGDTYETEQSSIQMPTLSGLIDSPLLNAATGSNVTVNFFISVSVSFVFPL